MTRLSKLSRSIAGKVALVTGAASGMGLSTARLFAEGGWFVGCYDTNAQGLEALAGGQRMIGVISHVGELAERLPDQIEVVKQGNSSAIRA